MAQPLAINPDSSFIGPPMNLYVQFLALTLAGWVNRHQQSVIEYLQAENRSLREQLGPKRLRWTDAQRRRLAEKGKTVSRDVLDQLGTIVTPDTLLRWYRKLVAAKYDGSGGRGNNPGRPRTRQSIADLVTEMAGCNPSYVELLVMWSHAIRNHAATCLSPLCFT